MEKKRLQAKRSSHLPDPSPVVRELYAAASPQGRSDGWPIGRRLPWWMILFFLYFEKFNLLEFVFS